MSKNDISCQIAYFKKNSVFSTKNRASKSSVLNYPVLARCCGDDVPKLEPVRVFSFHRVDKIVRHLRRIYKENPAYFDIPAFAQKVY